MVLYAIRVSYGDGCTYSGECLDLFHFDQEYLQDLCDTFTILNDDKDCTYRVVPISVKSDKFTSVEVEAFKSYWNLGE